MRRFILIREVDESGVSGTGLITEGVEFSDGQVSMMWLSKRPALVEFKSYPQAYESMDHVLAVHGHGGLTRAVFLDTVDSEE